MRTNLVIFVTKCTLQFNHWVKSEAVCSVLFYPKAVASSAYRSTAIFTRHSACFFEVTRKIIYYLQDSTMDFCWVILFDHIRDWDTESNLVG